VQHPLSDLAHFCDVGVFNAEIALAASRRGPEESADLSAYLETPEFNELAARLEPRVRAGITCCARMPLADIAAELALPVDQAVAWLVRIGVPLEIAIDLRAAA
jgi:tRNA U34 5-methylaminomethyl-2-thiouridine-forming methyltransferase MnmC